MEQLPRPNLPSPAGLLDPKDIQTRAQQADPEYGKAFTDANWDAITDRLEQLARLLWQFSVREAEEEAKAKKKSEREAGSGQAAPLEETGQPS
jgi:hypothetical protein